MDAKLRERSIELIERVQPQGQSEILADFTSQFPTSVFLDIIGLPIENLPQFLIWNEAISQTDSEVDPDRSGMMGAMRDTSAYLATVLAERRARPETQQKDIISAALNWEIDGEPVTDDDILSCLLLLFMAGLDTVSSQLSYIFYYLATHPEDRAKAADPEWIPKMVEELLRAYTIVRTGRKITRDIDFHGCPLKAGEMVSLDLAHACRDEDEYPDGTTINFDRGSFRNLAFGAGVHRCLGSHLARRELIIAVEEWHRRIPDYQIAEGAVLTEHSGHGIHGVDALPLVWSV